MAKNKGKEGKKFEEDFKNSVNQEKYWVHRPPDTSNSYGGGSFSRFTNTSLCDYVIYDCIEKQLYLNELKSTKSTSVPFATYDLQVQLEQLESDLSNFRATIRGKQNDAQKSFIKALNYEIKLIKRNGNSKSIKLHQIVNMYKDCKKYNIIGYIIINFRETKHTYKINIIDFVEKFWTITNKKSINEQDCLEIGTIIKQQPKGAKSSRWLYDIYQ